MRFYSTRRIEDAALRISSRKMLSLHQIVITGKQKGKLRKWSAGKIIGSGRINHELRGGKRAPGLRSSLTPPPCIARCDAVGIDEVDLKRAVGECGKIRQCRGLEIRFPSVHIVDHQRPMIAAMVRLRGRIAPANQMQFLILPQAKPSAGKLNAGRGMISSPSTSR